MIAQELAAAADDIALTLGDLGLRRWTPGLP
jgi:hypothetical protein